MNKVIINSRKIYVPYNFELRWVLKYHNKLTKFGMWTKGIEDPATKASCQSRHGLVFAGVQAKNRSTRETKTIIGCHAPDYVEHRWIAAAPSPVRAPVPVHIMGAIQGITLVTRDFKFHCYVDGTIKRVPMNERSASHG